MTFFTTKVSERKKYYDTDGNGFKWPIVKKGTSNRWTSWRSGSIEGTIYKNSSTTTDPVLSTVEGFSYYAPDNYLGYVNLDLFASYTVATADVDIYTDANYDFLDNEITVSNANGSGHYYTFTYTGDTSIGTGTTLTISYVKDTTNHSVPAFTYDSISATVKRMAGNETVAVGAFDKSTGTYKVNIAPFGDGKFYITVVAEYKGHQYSYGITLDVIDTTGQ